MIDSLLNQASITLYLYTLNWVYVLSNYVLRNNVAVIYFLINKHICQFNWKLWAILIWQTNFGQCVVYTLKVYENIDKQCGRELRVLISIVKKEISQVGHNMYFKYFIKL